jgi:hypothetical protein
MLDQLDTVIGFATVMLGVSLLITSLTQAVLSLLDTRGRNLRSGLKHLLQNVAPGLRDRAAELSERIVRHPLISDSSVGRGIWGRATAIKKEELLPILDHVLKAAGKPDGLAGVAVEERRAIEQWFDPAMARTSQWFAMYSRWITVALAIVVAVAMHLDALAVFRQLQRDRDTRARLVAMSETLLEQSPGVIAQVERVRGIYVEILKELLTSESSRFRPEAAPPDGEPPASRDRAVDWIERHARSGEDAAALTRAFHERLDARLDGDLQRALDRFNTTRADLTAPGLSLYPGEGHTWADLAVNDSHVWGIAASVLLLSLGAPFWFNTLKNLSSLRTVVAQRASPPAVADAESAREAAKAPEPPLPTPPKGPA